MGTLARRVCIESARSGQPTVSNDETKVGWALLLVARGLSRPGVANLRLNQRPVNAFLLILASPKIERLLSTRI